jgi:hypothetical protein
MAFGGSNRRRNRRFNFHTDLIIEKEKSSQNAIKGITRDLSMGGACCLIPIPIKVFTIVNVKMYVDNDPDPLDISGRVTWIRELSDDSNELEQEEDEEKKPKAYIIGVQFLTLYSTKKERLQKVLNGHIEE